MPYLSGGGASRGGRFAPQAATSFFAGPTPSFRAIADSDGTTVWVNISPSTSARNTLVPIAIGACPLTMKAMSGQTANLSEWQSSAGSVVAAVSPTGRILAGTNGPNFNGHLQGPSTMYISYGQSPGTGSLAFLNGTTAAFIIDSTNARTQCNVQTMGFNYTAGPSYLANLQSQPIAFKIVSTEIARFATSGSYLLGTTSDSGRLTVYGAGTTTGITAYFANSAGTPSFQLRDDGAWSHGNNAPTATQTGYTTFANLTTKRTVDVSTATLADVANILGTLIQDLKTKGILSA